MILKFTSVVLELSPKTPKHFEGSGAGLSPKDPKKSKMLPNDQVMTQSQQ
jgi:hypothetical protein